MLLSVKSAAKMVWLINSSVSSYGKENVTFKLYLILQHYLVKTLK